MSQDDSPESSSASPFEFLKFAATRVPALNWTIGVGGIVAVAAMIYFWNVPAPVAVLGSVALLIGMIGLYVVANLIHPSARQRRKRDPASILMLITGTILIIGTAVLSFTSLFFDWPIHLRSLYYPDSPADVRAESTSAIQAPSISAIIYSMSNGQRSEIMAGSPEMLGVPSEGITDSMLVGLADWIESYFEVPATERANDTDAVPIVIPASEVRVQLSIPADGLGQITLERSPAGPIKAELWWVKYQLKNRLPLSQQAISSAPEEYSVRIEVPGYSDQVVQVTKSQPLDRELLFTNPEHLSNSFNASNYLPRVVFRADSDDRGATARLAVLVAQRGRLSVVHPDIQAEAERLIKENKEALAENPWLQIPMLEMEVDFAVSVLVKDVVVP